MELTTRLARLRQKIAQLAAADSARAIFGAEKHQYALAPVLPMAEATQFEQAAQLSLPADYRLFLTAIANGGVGPFYGLYSLAEGLAEAQLAADAATPNAWMRAFPLDNAATAHFLRYHAACIAEGDDDEIVYPEAPDPLTGVIFLAEYGCGWSYVLVVKGEQAGTVWMVGDYLSPVFSGERQWSFFDWYEDWLDRSLAELHPPATPLPLGRQNTILNYDGWKLTQIPPEVFENRGLKKLVFSRNALTEFPLEILQLKELRTLDLSMTPIVTLPEAIGELQQLKKLRLNYNYHLDLPATLAQLPALEELSMYYNYKLEAIPAVVGRLPSLKRLFFSYCGELRTVPAEIGALAQLETLHLNDTALTALPESIGSLQQLKYLSLGNTRLTRLPETFAQLHNLQALDLSIESLDLATTIPLLCQLPNLHSLTLVNHRDFPAALGQLTQVKKLTLKQNYALWHQGFKFLPLPENLTLLANLEELNLINNNQANQLPETIGRLTHLKALDICSTAIRDFPESLQQTPLETLRGLLSRDSANLYGVSPEAKEKVTRWFPRAKIMIW